MALDATKWSTSESVDEIARLVEPYGNDIIYVICTFPPRVDAMSRMVFLYSLPQEDLPFPMSSPDFASYGTSQSPIALIWSCLDNGVIKYVHQGSMLACSSFDSI